ncbi:cct4 [Symbiodinium sp. KB8]|nr:cct4 [Symbiodinium sp. KB8]
MAAAAPASGAGTSKSGEGSFKDDSKQADVRLSNIVAAKGEWAGKDGEVIITNDGATILSHMSVFHPTAKMLVELSKSQDIEAGDGTTSVVVLCGSLLDQCQGLLDKGIHPTVISDAYGLAVRKAEEVLTRIATPVDLADRAELIKAAITSMSSKVISQNSDMLAPLAVDAVLAVTDVEGATNVDLADIKVTKALGGTMDDTELVEGLVFNRRASHVAGAPSRVTDAKIGLVQFCLSAPKTDMENSVVVSDYTQMDRILQDERKYILGMCKKIKKSGCNVLLVQKSILRDALNEWSLHFLAKLGIMVVRDVERDDIEFISKTLGCKPIAHVDHMTPDKLGSAALAEEVSVGSGNKVIKITGVANPGRTVSLLVRGSNKLVLDETERSIHDALCVVRSIVKRRFLITGGGIPEIEVARELASWSTTLHGQESYCVRAFADAMEIIPYTLAENAGLHPIEIVTELRKRHAEGDVTAGINVKRGVISDIHAMGVMQPLLVSISALTLATETCRLILKIDDMVAGR